MGALEELLLGVSVNHRYVTIDGLRIHYAEAGTGPPVVLLHGWPQNWWEWRLVIPILAQHFRVICPDIRGLGWSEGAPDARYSLDQLARDIIGLLDALQLERASLVGHDWGLLAGYRACLNWPERFHRFVALAGVHPWIRDGATWRSIAAPWHIFVLAWLGKSARVQRRIAVRSLGAWRQSGEFSASEREVFLNGLSWYATASFYRNLVTRELPGFARHYRLMRLRVPTLHLNGAHDPLTLGMPLRFGDYADDMRFETVPGSGHFIAEEQPRFLSDRLIQFLGGN